MSGYSRHYAAEAYFHRLLHLSAESSGATRTRALLDFVPPRLQRLRVLDAGCGLGGFSAPLRDAHEIVGADINEACLRYIASRGWSTIRCDIEDPWPFDSGSFDLVLLGDVLEHLFAITAVIGEAKRVLKPGGRIVVAVPNAGYWRRRLRLLLRGDLSSDLSDHIRYFSPRSLAKVGHAAGLKVDGMRPYSWNSSLDAALPVGIAWGFVAGLSM